MKPDITLIFPSSPFLLNQTVFPPLGIMYLSEYLRVYGGMDVQCLDMGLGHTREMAEADVIGISFTTPQRFEAFELAKYYCRRGKKVIAGGPHATHMPHECLANGFDLTIRGRGEIDLLELLTGVLGPVNNLYPDRDALPIHNYLYQINGIPATPIMTTWGCPYSCSFCGKVNNEFEMQSAERTIAEIESINAKYGFEAFMIFDDVFIASKKRLARIAGRLGGRYTFRCFARSNLLDSNICELLAKLGVVEVGIGVESGSDDILRKNMKGTTRTMNTNAVKRLHSQGIRAKAFLIVGLPGETDETVVETANWIEEAQPDDIDVSIFQPMPGSDIFANPSKWGIEFSYNGNPGWYKGIPGEYETIAGTEFLPPKDIVRWRDILELEYKPKGLLR